MWRVCIASSDRHRGINIKAHGGSQICWGHVTKRDVSLLRICGGKLPLPVLTVHICGHRMITDVNMPCREAGFVIYHLWSVMKGRSFRVRLQIFFNCKKIREKPDEGEKKFLKTFCVKTLLHLLENTDGKIVYKMFFFKLYVNFPYKLK